MPFSEKVKFMFSFKVYVRYLSHFKLKAIYLLVFSDSIYILL